MRRKQAWMAALACVVFILDGLTIAACWMRTHAAEERREHAHRVIEHLRNVESAAQSLGSYARRYVSTANESSLQSYYQTEAKVKSLLEVLGALLQGNIKQEIYLVDLRDIVAKRFEWERKVLSVYRSDGKQRALALIDTLGGANSMDKVRAQLRDMENTERVLLLNHSADYALYRLGSLLAILLLTITGGIALWQAIKLS